MIHKSKSFENQKESFKKVENLNQYCSITDFDDKDLKFKIFKIKLVDMPNEIDEELFGQLFGNTLETAK